MPEHSNKKAFQLNANRPLQCEQFWTSLSRQDRGGWGSLYGEEWGRGWVLYVQWQIQDLSRLLLPPANKVWGKVICLQVCVCPQGGGWSRGVPGPSGGAWSCGVPGPWRVSGPGGSGLVLGGDPPPNGYSWGSRCILLECILVWQHFYWKLHENERNWTERGRARPWCPLDPQMMSHPIPNR